MEQKLLRRSAPSAETFDRVGKELIRIVAGACNKAMEEVPAGFVAGGLRRVLQDLDKFAPNDSGEMNIWHSDGTQLAGTGPAPASLKTSAPNEATLKALVEALNGDGKKVHVIKSLEELTKLLEKGVHESDDDDSITLDPSDDPDSLELPEAALRKVEYLKKRPELLPKQHAVIDFELTSSQLVLEMLAVGFHQSQVGEMFVEAGRTIKRGGEHAAKCVMRLAVKTREALPPRSAH